MPAIDFQHRQTAHCESGAISALLRHQGLDLSEPMAFGISGALGFAYVPFVKMNGMPLIAYRMPPGRLIKVLTARLGIEMVFERFRKPREGTAALKYHLDNRRPVGLQASVFWLPYFPEDMRFHFNAHNLVAYGYQNNDFLISDPTFEHLVKADGESLQRARFVKGVLAPKGLIYYPEKVPEGIDFKQPILTSIQKTCNMMLKTPVPIAGIKGIRRIVKKLQGMSASDQRNKLFVGHMIRMQEEIGTGGAGFRFLYASFLQESAAIFGCKALDVCSAEFTDLGDEWRRFALYGAKMLKGRMDLDYGKLATQLARVADLEEDAFKNLQVAVKNLACH